MCVSLSSSDNVFAVSVSQSDASDTGSDSEDANKEGGKGEGGKGEGGKDKGGKGEGEGEEEDGESVEAGRDGEVGKKAHSKGKKGPEGKHGKHSPGTGKKCESGANERPTADWCTCHEPKFDLLEKWEEEVMPVGELIYSPGGSKKARA